MTVRLSITYAATDGTMPENVEVEWQDMPSPPVSDVLEVLHAMAAIADRRFVSYEPVDLAPVTHRALVDIDDGMACCLQNDRNDITNGVVPVSMAHNGPDGQTFLGVAVGSVGAGALMQWAPSADGRSKVWRRADG